MTKCLLDTKASSEFSYKINRPKKGKKISIVADSMFHAMFNNEKWKKFAAYLISLTLNVSFDEIFNTLEYVNNKLDKERDIEKTSTVDFLCKINNEYVGIEMNNQYSPTRLERNISYASEIYKIKMKKGSNYNYQKVIQININNFSFYGDNSIINEFEIKNNNGVLLTDKIKFIYISIPNIRKKWYNNDILNELEKFILFMCEEDISISKKISEGNEIMNEYIDDAEYVSEEVMLNTMTIEEKNDLVNWDIKRMAKLEEKEEIAKKMLQDNIDFDTIIKYTNISKEDLQEL